LASEAVIPLLSLESTRVAALLAESEVLVDFSSVTVEEDDERLNVLAMGARCVSLSFFVMRQVEDMLLCSHAGVVAVKDGQHCEVRDVESTVSVGP